MGYYLGRYKQTTISLGSRQKLLLSSLVTWVVQGREGDIDRSSTCPTKDPVGTGLRIADAPHAYFIFLALLCQHIYVDGYHPCVCIYTWIRTHGSRGAVLDEELYIYRTSDK